MTIEEILAAEPGTMKLGEVVDSYKQLNMIRLAMQKEVDNVEAVEKKFREHLVNKLEKSDEKGVFGLKYKAQHKTKRIPKIKGEGDQTGWPALWGWITLTGRFDVLQKRLNDKAVMEMYDAGELPPGIETMLVSEISVTKV